MFRKKSRKLLIFFAIVVLVGVGSGVSQAQNNNPYRTVDNWAEMPSGREMGPLGDIHVDLDGEHIWAVVRCEGGATTFELWGKECVNSKLDPVVKFNQNGVVVESFGRGMFIWPHGLDVDPDGNIWVTDAGSSKNIPTGDSRGHQVVKFSPKGKVLMTLGTPGEAGSDHRHFNSPADVVVADNGDIFVADGHGKEGNNRVVKFSHNGAYISEWGGTGYAPSQFRALHAIAIDPDGKLYVADRNNNRIQLFDQAGQHLSTWTQFGQPSGIFFDGHGKVYVSDSESDNVNNPGYEMGIRIGDRKTGWVNEFILHPGGDPRKSLGFAAEFVTVDRFGNVYGAEPVARKLQKYIRVRP